jgi:hypothetical protein
LLDPLKIAISCVNAKFLQFDADTKLVTAVPSALQHSVFKPEVYVFDADLEIVQNPCQQLLCE